MSTQPRRIFQIDGIDGGILNIAEKPDSDRVVMVISNGEKEAQLSLSKESFSDLAGLQYSLRFSEPQADAPALKVVA